MGNETHDDSQAEIIIHQYYTMIYRYCYMKLSNTEKAQDLVQEVFCRFFQRIVTYRKDNKVRQVLFTIAHNLCIDEYRKQGHVKQVEFEEYHYCDESGTSVEQVLSLNNMLLQLQPTYMDTIILFYYYDFKIKEIAHIMNTSESNVKYRLTSAKNKLKMMFDKEGLTYEEWIT